MPTLVNARWAPSTADKYGPGWEKWKAWCRRHPKSKPRPASTFYVALYLNDLVLEKCRYGALDTAAAAIRWGNLKDGLQNPMENDFLSIVLEGAKRTIGKPPSQQKEPMLPEMVRQVMDRIGRSSNLIDRRTSLICILGFSGFMRISELLAVQVKHIQIKSEHLKIFIPKAKNDQQCQGHIIHIKRTNTTYCPVTALSEYLALTKLGQNEENFIISRLAKTKFGHNAHGRRPLTDTSVRDIFNREVAPTCYSEEPGSYSLHSLRSGGASAASNNGISDRLIGKHGRWKSGFSRDRYIKDNKRQRLSVTNSLGL